jgi:GrpB-like predicted nucleotidyltransferase (UPF0157 family)
MVDLHADPIELVDSQYDAWRERFEHERDRLERALEDGSNEDSPVEASLAGRVHAIEHVGSTAVPELPAKDIVDVDLVVADDAVPAVSDAVVDALGGTRHENSETWHVVAREHDGQRFNVHVFARRDDGWKRSVATRDVLRARPSPREEYAQLKRDLAGETDDLETYSTGKTELLEHVLRTARDADEFTFDFAVPIDD